MKSGSYKVEDYNEQQTGMLDGMMALFNQGKQG